MEYGRKKYGYGSSVDRLRMAFGGKMAYAENGVGIEREGDPKKTPASPYNPVTQETITSNFRNNEGMQEAQSPGKIDAYNFQLPASGNLDDLDDDMKQTLVKSDFGKDYLSGDGSLDQQYNKYSAKVVGYMKRNPDQALNAINQMIESGNENFQGLEGKSDAEKLSVATTYMTDKKIGDFHGALMLGELTVPRVSYHTPPSVTQRSEVGKGPVERKGFMVSVGNRAVRNEDAVKMLELAKAEGVDLSGSASGIPNKDAVNFLERFMDENGSQETGPRYTAPGQSSQKGQYYGNVDQYFIDADEREAQEQLQRAEQAQKARQQNRPRYDSMGRLIREEMDGGGMIYKRANRGTEIPPTKEEGERGVTSVSRGLFNRTENFGDKGTVKYPTKLAKLFTRKDLKAKF